MRGIFTTFVLLFLVFALGETNFAIGRTNFRPGRKRSIPSNDARESKWDCSFDPCDHSIDYGYQLTRHPRYRTHNINN
ncbi:hypothetical protein PRIPAC_77728 [Pristionchus pacificus]|uniref:C2H2-type domain-containing protein n=1 Tax=Pristionchus pacificus TaxID=54126 RepID=A0A2A6BYR2_PRIPA|nr:hypothetical protein PRIPAC_77728 [Pristionchus pacificus]|eukprot:PDM70911.1 hypothetical protein PRIPAC_44307 [Pristionchus pacificus]